MPATTARQGLSVYSDYAEIDLDFQIVIYHLASREPHCQCTLCRFVGFTEEIVMETVCSCGDLYEEHVLIDNGGASCTLCLCSDTVAVVALPDGPVIVPRDK